MSRGGKQRYLIRGAGGGRVRSVILAAILFLTPTVVAGQNFKHVDGYVLDINDFDQPIATVAAADLRETPLDLIGQLYPQSSSIPKSITRRRSAAARKKEESGI